MATPMLNTFSTTRMNYVAPRSCEPSSTKSHNNVVMCRNFTNFGARQDGFRVRKVAAAHSEPTTTTAKHVELKKPQPGDGEGIGIVRFLQGKELLITGATGFLAKVLVEKILREVPDVGKIYLMIKAPTMEAAMQRLKSEVIHTEVFKLLEETYGDSYSTFMESKLVPVIGNISDSGLGLEEDMARSIANKVDVIVNSAANTVFDESYDVALKINTNGPCNIMKFAKRCKQLKLFLHVSTAYTNGEREGNVMEKPFRMGDSIAREKRQNLLSPMLDVKAEFQLASQALSHNSSAREMKKLGMARANMFGWQDTYVFTKAMGEMMIDEMRGDVPVAIVRPSIIESTFKDPFPGWIQGNRMIDPVVINYGKGNMDGFPMDPDCVIDIIPADMVVSAILGAVARHGSMHEVGDDITVYHVGSSVANPLWFGDLARMISEHFNSYPYIDPNTGSPIKVSPFKIFKSAEDFSPASGQSAVTKKRQAYIEHMTAVYRPYVFYKGRFDISNTEKLMECMSKEERSTFSLDVRGINWDDYIKHVHIPGLRRRVMMKS